MKTRTGSLTKDDAATETVLRLALTIARLALGGVGHEVESVGWR